ncbi:MAG: methyltransferase domain-containing protein [Candidatus Norongarragalinales archaeon]
MRHAHYALRFDDAKRFLEPWLEIDGVKMHATRLAPPIEEAANKARLLKVQPNERVLDVCTGLGYSAIACAKRGAKVTTIEADEEVLCLAKKNPFSAELFSNPEIKIINGDANEVVKTFSDASFDCVLHDPPRFSFAGELYSIAFYRELVRVLKPEGRLFHYTGTANERAGKSFLKGVKRRLSDAGFERIVWREDALAFTAIKPRVKHY